MKSAAIYLSASRTTRSTLWLLCCCRWRSGDRVLVYMPMIAEAHMQPWPARVRPSIRWFLAVLSAQRVARIDDAAREFAHRVGGMPERAGGKIPAV